MRKFVLILGVLIVMPIVVLSSLAKPTESLAMEPDNSVGAPPVFMPQVIFDPILPILPLINGDFESGDAFWGLYLPNGATRPLIYEAGDLPMAPYSGNWMAWIVSEGFDGLHLLTQEVTIPEDATHLSLWHYDDFGPNCGGEGGLLITACGQITYTPQCSSQWRNKMVDVSSCAGETEEIRVGLNTEGVSYPDTIFIDEIEFVNNSKK